MNNQEQKAEVEASNRFKNAYEAEIRHRAFIDGVRWQEEQFAPQPTHEAVAVAFGEWMAKEGYQTTTLNHEKETLWQTVDFDWENHECLLGEEKTTAQVFTLFTESEEYKSLKK